MSKFDQIIAAGAELAAESHYLNLTRRDVAKRCSVSVSLVSHHFGDIASLREAVMVYAVNRSILPVVLQGIVAGDEIAINAPEALKSAAVNTLVAQHG